MSPGGPRDITIDCSINHEELAALRAWVRSWPPGPFRVCLVAHVHWPEGGLTRVHMTQEETVLNAQHAPTHHP